MTLIMTRVGMPLTDFMQQHNQQPFELIHGERRPKLPTVFGHSKTLKTFFIALYLYVTARNLGEEVYSETTFILPGSYSAQWVEGSRTPDIMYYAAGRIAAYEADRTLPETDLHPLELVPDLVVEVVSPNDSYSEIDEKVDMYLEDGVQQVWIADPQRRKITVYSAASDVPMILKGNMILKGGMLLSDFELPLVQVFGIGE